MKRILLVAACLVFALMIASPASAVVVLDFGIYGLGTSEPGTPAGDQYELDRLNYLISLANPGTPDLPAPDTPNYTSLNLGTATAAAIPLPYPATFDAGDKFSTSSTSFTLPGSYSYLLAKFANNTAYFYIGGLTGDIEIGNPFGEGGISHVSLFGPSQVPEPGTVMLLGFGLAGIGTFRRFKKHC